MIRTGIGIDVHRFASGRALVLGGVRMDYRLGLAGHSDADVLCHAVADAMLGAVAAGDIGTHFPDTDTRWKDARSLDLLAKVADIVREKKGRPINVDATVVAEEPRIMPVADKMCANLAAALGIETGAVSVKATTAEGMGTLGRHEGILAIAVATVEMSA